MTTDNVGVDGPENPVIYSTFEQKVGPMRHRFERLLIELTLLGIAPAIFGIVSGCSVNLDLLPDNLVATGSPFVISGTAAVIDNDGPCLIWIGENGVTYHLFQDPRVDNETFDQVVTPGVTSRLQIAVRSDIVLTCQVGTIAEVQNVLEIVE